MNVSPTDRLITLPGGELPTLTLGYEAIDWAEAALIQPNGPRAGEPFRFTPSQGRFLLHWYAVNPDGSWVYHHSARRWAKGAGKSPLAAVALQPLTMAGGPAESTRRSRAPACSKIRRQGRLIPSWARSISDAAPWPRSLFRKTV